jgi:3'(2'), 5'-bisphosphate nucleotidase
VSSCVQKVIPKATTEEVTKWIEHGNGQVASRYWTLDPSDQCAVFLALVADGEVKVGILACPALTLEGTDCPITGVLFVAVRDQGTIMQSLVGGPSQPIQVATSTSSEDGVHRMVESFESAHVNQSLQKSIAEAAGIKRDSLRMYSQAKYGVVAAGQAVLYLRLPNPKKPNYKENIWDHAAGSIFVEEAGGRVTDMHGECLDFTEGDKLAGTGVVVSSGNIHSKILAALKEHLQSSL